MKTDLSTKTLLLVIAVALWGILLRSFFPTAASVAQQASPTPQRVIIVGVENNRQITSSRDTLPVTLQYLSSGTSLPVRIVEDKQK